MMHFSSAQSKPFGDYRFLVCLSGFSLLIPALLTGHQAAFQCIAVSFLSALIFLKACIPTPPRKKLHQESLPEFLQRPGLRGEGCCFLPVAVGYWQKSNLNLSKPSKLSST
jgi:hypothetical protein